MSRQVAETMNCFPSMPEFNKTASQVIRRRIFTASLTATGSGYLQNFHYAPNSDAQSYLMRQH